jgi:hypothetical protein
MEYKKHKIIITKKDGLYFYSIGEEGEPFLKCCEKFVAQETACRQAIKLLDVLTDGEIDG